ncbi:Gfo/Idh/MocA family protein [Natronosalvus halobius]|uniref:Gfo/Idh/MocA family protein n=1 Tax=Natronosalvus halobius TaxID=2953746 RepID=UPI00209E83A1|nr:Gfo/Idh/MocA family oxidoreductase [Natronosalvus halobius]USZ72438.1 Gfo/Idh/MocA family oxidoreductase [Natronosalvus halobius]
MSDYTVGIVGTGPHPEDSDHDGYSMGHRHARSFRRANGCQVAACADIVADHAAAFGDEFGLDDERVFTDVQEMLDGATPDVVSICTPPSTHGELVETCARHESVQAVHCEKPMAETVGESRRLVEVCEHAGVQLTINLQNRCSDAAGEIKRVIEDGAIGDLERVEIGRQDLLQTGLHHVDLANYVLGDEPVAWVLGQIDYPDEHVWYTNMPSERQGLGMWAYESGVHALCSTGAGAEAVGPHTNRFIGTDGEVEFQLGDGYRIRTDGKWRTVEVGGDAAQDAAIVTLIEALETDEEPIISGRRALGSTEVVFGIWESARKRGRVSLPLDIEDNPLAALIESGELPPEE